MQDLSDVAVLGFAAGAIGVAILSWLVSKSSAAPKRVGNRHVLTYGLVLKISAAGLGIALPSLVLASYLQGQAKIDVVIFSLGLAALICGSLVLEFFRVRIEFDRDHVYTFSPWRRSRVIPWNAFIGRKYSAIMAWHTFATNGFGSVRISDWLQGGKEFVDYFENRSA